MKVRLLAVVFILLLSACGPDEKTLTARTQAAATATAAQWTATPMPSPTRLPPTATLAPPTPTPSATSQPTQLTSPTPAATLRPTLDPNAVQTSTLDGMVMVYVPAGDFIMGSDPAKDPSTQKNETPQHKVTLDGFWMDKYEVSNTMFARFVAATSYKTEAEKAGSMGWVWDRNTGRWVERSGVDWRRPRGSWTGITGLDSWTVVQVAWADAAAYCQWAGRQLPTEAQWEKAARGTDGRLYPWGNTTPISTLLNFRLHREYAIAVGSFPGGASPYKVLDMSGNAAEWVADWYDETYYAASPAANPTGPNPSTMRVVRGGSWLNDNLLVRSAYRNFYDPAVRNDSTGFRCVRPQ